MASSSEFKQMILIAKKYGQLGNNLFLMGHVLAYCLENGLNLAHLGFFRYAHYFENTCDDIFCRLPVHHKSIVHWMWLRILIYLAVRNASFAWRKLFGNSKKFVFLQFPFGKTLSLSNAGVADLTKETSIILLDGWPIQHAELFTKHADHIRKTLRPLPQYEATASQLIERVRAQSDISIGVHIRQGDYRDWAGGRYYYETEQYAAFMQQLTEVFQDSRVGFFVCSDQTQDKSLFANFNCVLGGENPIVDLITLSKCDYIIGTVSTFSLWAAFYGNVPICIVEDPEEELRKDSFSTEYAYTGYGYPRKTTSAQT